MVVSYRGASAQTSLRKSTPKCADRCTASGGSSAQASPPEAVLAKPTARPGWKARGGRKTHLALRAAFVQYVRTSMGEESLPVFELGTAGRQFWSRKPCQWISLTGIPSPSSSRRASARSRALEGRGSCSDRSTGVRNSNAHSTFTTSSRIATILAGRPGQQQYPERQSSRIGPSTSSKILPWVQASIQL